MKTFYKLSVTLPAQPTEDITGFLWQASPEGLLEEGNTVILFFPDAADNREIVERLLQLLGMTDYKIQEETVEQIDWNAEWEQSLSVIRVSPTLLIRPSFKEYTPLPGERVIVIEPKMSFGTGEHQTTRVMLQVLETTQCTGLRVLDVGTGSGVLAIASVMFGAEYALAIDNDDWCLENGIENAALNGVADKVSVRTAVVEDITETDFDIVIANIQKDVLLHIAGALTAKCKQGGLLLLSGLLRNDEQDIRASYTALGLEFIETLPLDEWIGMKFRKL